MTIDTHQGYKRLIEAGVPEQQAEAHIALIGEWIEHQLVTRAYLDLRLAELERRLTNRIITVVGLATALMSVLMAALTFFN